MLREKSNYQLPLPDRVSNALDAFRVGLHSEDHRQTFTTTNDLFVYLWSTRYSRTENNVIPDPTERWLLLRGISRTGELDHPKGVTSPIAKTEFLMRLAFLMQMHIDAEGKHGGSVEMARKEWQKWFTEKEYSTFNTLRSLTHRASAISYSTRSLPKIWWVDRVNYQCMLFKGHRIHMDSIRQVFANLEEEMVSVWENDILCGLDIPFEYGEIADDLSNTSIGYSFATDPRNPWFQNKDLLLAAIMANPRTRSKFIVSSMDGVTRFNKLALHAWLRAYAKFQKLLCTRAEMTSGSSSRATELHAMNRENTLVRPSRSLVAMGKHLATLNQYVKTNSQTGHDRLIPHALDAFTSDLIIRDTAIARTFAQLAAEACFPGDTAVSALYKERLFVNYKSPFTTPDLTAHMSLITAKELPLGLKVNDWRHTTSGFQRKLCTLLDDLLEGSQEQQVLAEQFAHGKTIHDRVYGVSSDSLDGPSEDVLPLFLDASTDWQVECRVVPGGLGLSYCDARTTDFKQLTIDGRINPGALKRSLGGPVIDHDAIAAKVAAKVNASLLDEDAIADRVAAKLMPMFKDMMSQFLNESRSVCHGREKDIPRPIESVHRQQLPLVS